MLAELLGEPAPPPSGCGDDREMPQRPGGWSAWPLTRRRRSVVPRRLGASGSGPVAQRCVAGIECLLESTPFRLRKDLGEHDQDDTGPQCPTERVEQAGGHQSKRLCPRRRSEGVSPTWAARPTTKAIPRLQCGIRSPEVHRRNSVSSRRRADAHDGRPRGGATDRRRTRQGPRVLMLTTFDLVEYVYEALAAGAKRAP